METLVVPGTFKIELDRRKRIAPHGIDYWMARDVQQVLKYERWESFQELIQRARLACESAGREPDHHFRLTANMITAGKGAQRERADWYLSRYACYLVAMNGDPSKPEIGFAQTYFAVQARKQEILEQAGADEKRLELRNRVKTANKALAGAAYDAGVRKLGIFHDKGYQGLYGLGLGAIKERKKIDAKEDLLDRAGRAELAANAFRITQTEQKLVRDHVKGEQPAIDTHHSVGRAVRNTIEKLGGTMPEDLPVEPSIKKIEASRRARVKALSPPS